MRTGGKQRKASSASAADASSSGATLLRTKLLIPPLPGHVMERQRLDAYLPDLGHARVTTIVAPPGYGKTVTAARWAKQLAAAGLHVAWLTLDAEDDEPGRYLHYLLAAMQQAIPSLQLPGAAAGALLPQRVLLAELINALSEFDAALYLFIDNYSLVSQPQIGDAMSYLLQHGPQALHLVLVGTTAPRLPLGLLRANRAVFDIDAEKLRFDVEETQRFVTRENLHDLAAAEVGALQQKTGGWIAALGIACHNLREAADPHAALHTLSGGSRRIGTYLGELLKGTPPARLDLMLRLSILDKLCAPLCQAVSGSDDAGPLLQMLATRYQLLSAIDDEQHWYRYHPLVAEYLRQRLDEEHPGAAAGLHRRAAAWYAQQEMWAEAIAHAIAGGDREQAVGWIEKATIGSLQRGDLLTIMGWHHRFPHAALNFHPEVQINLALAHLLIARQKEAEDMLVEIDAHIDDQPPGLRPHLRWQCKVLHAAAAAICHDDTVRALALALECLGEDHRDSWISDAAVNVARFCYAKQGDLLHFHALPWHSGSDANDPRFVFTMIYRLCFLGLAEASQLHIQAAERCYREACDIARRHQGGQAVILAIPVTFLAEMLYEQDRSEEAEAMLQPWLELIHAACPLDVVLSAQRTLTRCALLRGNIEQAYAALEQGENLGHVHGWGRLRAAMLGLRLRIVLEEGRLMEATACLAQMQQIAAAHPLTSRCAWSQIHDWLGLSTALMHCRQGDITAALDGLTRLAEVARKEQQPLLLLRARTGIAIARLAAGDNDGAIAEFSEVLALGSQAGACRSIVDAGPEIGPLLLEAKSRTGEHGAYIDRLLTAWRRLYKSPASGADSAPEPLSPRERNVLELVAAGQSNKQIAQTLGIAPETVKTHLKNLFIKLNVSSRAQAVARLNSL